MLAVDHCAAPQEVDCAVFRRAHQPGARILRNPRFRPLLKGGYQCVLSQFLGDTNVVHNAGQRGD